MLKGYLIIEYFLLFWFILIGAFVQIMFFTVCERKALALIQRRVGPKVVGVRGRLQCLADSAKLLTKIFLSPRKVNIAMFQSAAFGGFWVSWFNFANTTYGPGLDIMEVEYNIFFMLGVTLAFSCAWLVSGWAAISRYSMLGCFRSAAQFITLEILMSFILLTIFCITNTFNYELIIDLQEYTNIFLFIPSAAFVMFFSFLIETNRPPFDLSEAESDVVAGYNVEYSGILFGLFYLGEYLNLFAACILITAVFNGGWSTLEIYISYLLKSVVFIINIFI